MSQGTGEDFGVNENTAGQRGKAKLRILRDGVRKLADRVRKIRA